MEPYPLAYDDIPANQLLGGRDVRKSGMLRKKTGGRKIPLLQNLYDLRFVIIKKGWVYYYENRSSKKPKNKFSLHGFSNRVFDAEEEQATMPFTFKIYPLTGNTRTWYFACENRKDMDEWMESFRLEIEQHNSRGSNMTRQSRSCPNHPPRDANSHSHNNARLHWSSVNIPAVDSGGELPALQYFPSLSDVASSGFGSSTTIEQPDDYYEPIEDGHTFDDDEFCTDSDDSTDDYENPSLEYNDNIGQNNLLNQGYPSRQPMVGDSDIFANGSRMQSSAFSSNESQGRGLFSELSNKFSETKPHQGPPKQCAPILAQPYSSSAHTTHPSCTSPSYNPSEQNYPKNRPKSAFVSEPGGYGFAKHLPPRPVSSIPAGHRGRPLAYAPPSRPVSSIPDSNIPAGDGGCPLSYTPPPRPVSSIPDSNKPAGHRGRPLSYDALLPRPVSSIPDSNIRAGHRGRPLSSAPLPRPVSSIPDSDRPLSYAPATNHLNPLLPKRPVSMAYTSTDNSQPPILLPRQKRNPSPPSHAAPALPNQAFEQGDKHLRQIPYRSNCPKHELPQSSFESDPIPPTSPQTDHHTRRRSEVTIKEEHHLPPSQQKRHSAPVVLSLKDELVFKLGARNTNSPSLPDKDYKKEPLQQPSWSRPTATEKPVTSPKHTLSPTRPYSPMRSPKGRLPTLTEPPEDAEDEGIHTNEVFPSRPPPMPPCSKPKTDSRFGNQWNLPASTQARTVWTPYSSEQFSPLPSRHSPSEIQFTMPSLPPKPGQNNNFAKHQTISQTGTDQYYCDSYDDTVVVNQHNDGLIQEDPGIYDNMSERECSEELHEADYEPPEIIYENEDDETQVNMDQLHIVQPVGEAAQNDKDLIVPSWKNKVKSPTSNPQKVANSSSLSESQPPWMKNIRKPTTPTGLAKPLFQDKKAWVQKTNTAHISAHQQKSPLLDSQKNTKQLGQNNKALNNGRSRPAVASKPKDLCEHPKFNNANKPVLLQKPNVLNKTRTDTAAEAPNTKPSPPSKPKPGLPAPLPSKPKPGLPPPTNANFAALLGKFS